ncbi:Vacuolar protein-sorting protein BRO1 [Beauveria bassiana]|nr:Vacuolar protein-sorting protein BRO1 [Beauveria bassiana]KAH8718999.1 Vacuolar protein-sorting protein BRO1 [Beauveria bassiana]
MSQSPMISVPVKATNEIDWVTPLKSYIRNTYGDDPERYAEECETLNRLRQDMRGAGKESTSGRDMLYRYYGQLELLDLRFPIDEQHIKISFTWFDAFTHKPTTQYSLAFEKASVIFNISAILSAHAALQNRADDSTLKVAYHSFQASAGMFTYINENFLHAPSFDLSRETVKALINVMLAQAQEIFIEKQSKDNTKIALRAKLAAQAAYLYSQALEGVQENVTKALFEKVWLTMVTIKTSFFTSMAQYYQGLADEQAGQHGIAVARFMAAEALAKEADRLARNFPSNVPSSSNLSAECGAQLQDLCKRHYSSVQDKHKEALKDNDYIYHQTVPAEASLPAIAKLPAAKPIPVSELYAGQDIQRITGPDLFAKIVPMAVTESASLYDEEKAKLVRAETEKVDTANGEMAASLDYLRLPGALQVLKGGFDRDIPPDENFRQWCEDIATHDDPASIFEFLSSEKRAIIKKLEETSTCLDREEGVCEKMRSKYSAEWSQQPSARLTTTLRSDIRGYREALDEASRSDGQLSSKLQQNQADFNEMRDAVNTGRVDQMFQEAISKARARSSHASSPAGIEANLLDTDFGESGPSVMDQIAIIEDILKRLNLIKRERNQVLKDLKEKVHDDDISQVLILNKKSISNYENQLFQQELEKFRPHQNRLLQANHKQSALMKELTLTFNALLQDRRVRSEQSKYETVQRQRSSVINRYKRTYQEFLDLYAGLQSAKNWYGEMRESVQSLEKNVETFVNNRRAEGAQLLDQIERDKSSSRSNQAALEQERLRGLMERMSMEGTKSPPQKSRPTPTPLFQSGQAPRFQQPGNYQGQHQMPNSPPAHQQTYGGYSSPAPPASTFSQPTYNPSQYGITPGPTSPPPNQASFGMNTMRQGPQSPPAAQTSFSHTQQQPYQGYHQRSYSSQSQQHVPQHAQPGYVPPGFVPPPPPPGPPPLGPQQTVHYGNQDYDPTGGRPPSSQARHGQGQQPHDPWAGLSAWK